jgi:hypothetical protein
MKSKSFFAGALGLLLLFAGQNVAAQEGALPPPDRDSSILPAPDQSSAIPASQPIAAPGAEAPGTPAKKTPIKGIFGKGSGDTESPVKGIFGRGSGDKGSPAKGAPEGVWARQEPGTGSQAGAPEEAARETKALPRTGLYMGLMAGTVFPIYDVDDTDWDSTGGEDIRGKPTPGGGGLFFGWDFGFVTTEAGALVSLDRGKGDYGSSEYTLKGVSLLVPLVFKLDFHLGPVTLQPLAGGYLNFALGDLRSDGNNGGKDPYANPLFGLMFGGALGFKLGRGSLFLDSRYAMDLGKTAAAGRNGPVTIWKRSGVMLNLGYQFYIGGKE